MVDTHYRAGVLVLGNLSLSEKVSAVDEIEAVSLANVFVRIVGNKSHKGVILM